LNLFVDATFTNVSVGHERSRVLVLVAIVLIRRITSSVGDRKNHVVGGCEAMDFSIDATFSDVFVGVSNESSWVLVFESVILVRGVTSSMRDGQDHVVGGSKSMNLLIKSLLTNISVGVSSEGGVLVLISVVLIGALSSIMGDWENHVVSRGKSMDFFIDATLTNVLVGLRFVETDSLELSGEGLASIVLVGSISSGMRDRKNHVVC